MRRVVIVNDKMQQGYRYELSAPVGRDFDPQFRPDLTPKQMLELGATCGSQFSRACGLADRKSARLYRISRRVFTRLDPFPTFDVDP